MPRDRLARSHCKDVEISLSQCRPHLGRHNFEFLVREVRDRTKPGVFELYCRQVRTSSPGTFYLHNCGEVERMVPATYPNAVSRLHSEAIVEHLGDKRGVIHSALIYRLYRSVLNTLRNPEAPLR